MGFKWMFFCSMGVFLWYGWGCFFSVAGRGGVKKKQFPRGWKTAFAI